MRISVMGAGYVGLVSAVCFADRGYEVLLSSEDIERVNLINNGIAPFYETDLQEALTRVVRSSKLRATSIREKAIAGSEFTFIASGTPSKSDGSVDLSYVKGTSRKIGRALAEKDEYHLIVVRSTVPPRTTDSLVKPLIEKCSGKRAGSEFGLVMQPEFLRQGSAIHDTMNPDRIILGEFDSKSGDTLENLYRDFYGEKLPPVLRTNLRSAEMIKYASNAFLATKISFINEIAGLCERIPGLDVVKVADGMGFDKRIGRQFLNAGAGFGGSCFPKDLKGLIALARSVDCNHRVLESTLRVNIRQATHVVELVQNELPRLKGKRIAVLGLSFKPGTNDLREAPSLRIIRVLLRKKAIVVVYDPVSMKNGEKVLGRRIRYADSIRSCLKGCDVAVLVTEWNDFKTLTPANFKEWMRRPIVVDARRVYEPDLYQSNLTYRAVGLGR